MKRLLLFAVLFCWQIAHADIPPAQKLLPADTLLFLSVPDSTKLGEVFKNSPQNQLWRDPAMEPFRKDFMNKFEAEFLGPLEKELGVKFKDYMALARGQFAFALTQNGWKGKPGEKPGFVLLLDARDKSDQLKTNLMELKKQWNAASRPIKTEKIRDIEFTTIITSEDEIDKTLSKVFPKQKDAEATTNSTEKIEITVGQSGSLLLVGNVPAVLEKVLINQSGGTVPSIADDAAFDSSYSSMFRDAQAFIWVNPKPFMEILAASDTGSAQANPLAPKPDKMMAALGLSGLKGLAGAYIDTPEGIIFKLFINSPESTRQGIFRIFTPEIKDSGPLPFVPADTVKFSRWRLDLQKAMAGFEKMMGDISPAASGVFKLLFENAGKDQDPDFDFRKDVFGNLGDDLVICQKASRGTSAEELESPPTLYLISSPVAEKLAHAFKVGLGSFAQESFKEREFLGRKAYSMSLANPLSHAAPESIKPLHFAASGGYVAFSTDVAYLEEFLRSSEFQGKKLSEMAGLTDIAQKVGGTGTGLLVLENQAELNRATFEALKKNAASADAVLGQTSGPVAAAAIAEDSVKKWANFSLLPPFEAIAKYFYFSAYAGTFDANGITIKFFAPVPPGLKK